MTTHISKTLILCLALAITLGACDSAEPESTTGTNTGLDLETERPSAGERATTEIERRGDSAPESPSEESAPTDPEDSEPRAPLEEESATPTVEPNQEEANREEEAPSGEEREPTDEEEVVTPTEEEEEETTPIEEEAQEDETADPGEGDPFVEAPGSTCGEALSLSDSGALLGEGGSEHTWTANGLFEGADNYNPLDTSGKAPGCSLVYDAKGSDVVFSVTLQPGERIDVLYVAVPTDVPAAMYFLDSCPEGTWPDFDESGMCGSNEYVAQGFCGFSGSCEPLSLSLTHPWILDGEATGPKQYWLVLDALESGASEWVIDWSITQAN